MSWARVSNCARVRCVYLHKLVIRVWAQSPRGLPRLLLYSVPVSRGNNCDPGSKTTSLNGWSSGRRKMCPSQWHCAWKTWVLKRQTLLHFLRTLALEMRLINAAGILVKRRKKRACAPSKVRLSAVFKCKRCKPQRPLLQTRACILSTLFFREILEFQTRLYSFMRPCISPTLLVTSTLAVLKPAPYVNPSVLE